MTNEKRKRLKEYYKQRREIFGEWRAGGYRYPPPRTIPMPLDLRGLRCGARTKSTASPCKQKAIYENGRCKFHGGLSTGPRTVEGKRKSAQNGFQKKSN